MHHRDLPDGTYSFDVRGDEESQQDGASFTVDTVPPVAQFASPPPPLSLESSMYLEVVASDEASPVSVDCKLERVGSDDRTAPPQLSGMSSLGRWERCDSPLQVAPRRPRDPGACYPHANCGRRWHHVVA